MDEASWVITTSDNIRKRDSCDTALNKNLVKVTADIITTSKSRRKVKVEGSDS
jgi:hypothetical protein